MDGNEKTLGLERGVIRTTGLISPKRNTLNAHSIIIVDHVGKGSSFHTQFHTVEISET
ncbi:hypothetical protein KFK09_017810 [Dendrobium nobile]|uniref:Uncharacterized protein n=1 Tax=Dendrobium nobile TaxID=94219 RepID=A0A8T3AU64_DENNO|nr:hypothetical protein KFK09_017810 [Dendrobium nobile]